MKIKLWAIPALALLTMASAHADSCTARSAGMSTTDDVTFAGAASDECMISRVNPRRGKNGNTTGFDGVFGSGWSLLGKVSGPGSATVNGVNFEWAFSQATPTTGTWSLTTDKDATFDLVFAMRAGNRSGSFLFDGLSTAANHVNSQNWAIHWNNSRGHTPDYSSLTFFERNVVEDSQNPAVSAASAASADAVVSAVPESETYALMLAGLGALAFMVRRSKAA